MDRNPNDLNTSPTGNSGGSGNYGTAGYGTGSASGTDSGTGQLGTAGGVPGSTPPRADMPPASAADTASGMQGLTAGATAGATSGGTREGTREAAREKLGDAAEKARGWKHSMEQGLADRLQAGASKLREKAREMPAPSTAAQGSAGMPAYAGASGTPGTAGSSGTAGAGAAVADRARSVEQNLARGMDATADWLRNGDLQSTVEEQARTNPGRTLLVALGLGYLLGKTLKR